MSNEIYGRYTVVELQYFDNLKKLNPIDVSLDSNSLINELFKYKKYKYWFIIRNLLFSLSIKNDTKVIFMSRDALKNANEEFINSKLYRSLGVVYLIEVKNLDLIKGNWKSASVIFSDSENILLLDLVHKMFLIY